MNTPFTIDPTRDALIVVDVQNDFCPGGALAVPNGDLVVAPLNRALALAWATVVATRDWHPEKHGSFREFGGRWPPHCVQNTSGADFHPHLNVSRFRHIVNKGQNPDDPGYSAVAGTGLVKHLNARGVKRAFVGGLATDYCVKATAIDLLKSGFAVVVLTDAIRAVAVKPGDEQRARDDMKRAGAQLGKVADFGSTIP